MPSPPAILQEARHITLDELINLSKQAMPIVVVSRCPKSIPIRTAMTNIGGNGEATYAGIRVVLAELGANPHGRHYLLSISGP